MAIYPTSTAGDSDLYIAKNGLSTVLSSSVDNIVTTIPVTSTTGFPSVGYVVIDSEVIKYTSTNATNFLGCTRGADGTSASSHTTNALVKAAAVADHHNALKEEVKAIEQNLSDRIGLGSTQLKAINGTAGAPAYSFASDLNTGLYCSATDQITVSLGGTGRWNFVPGGQLYGVMDTSNDTQYSPLSMWAGGSGNSNVMHSIYHTNGVTTAKKIWAMTQYFEFVCVHGTDGSGNVFDDIVTASYGGTVSVVNSHSANGSPSARTYSVATADLRVAMASGTYKVTCYGFNIRSGS